MTQGQWLRFTGKNPSRFAPPHGLVMGLMHPVEQVTWLDCDRVVTRLGLQLPTGAQWEYAARAGEPSPWWLGPADTPPDGCCNLADVRLLADKGVKGGLSLFEEDYDDGWAAHAPVDAFLPNPFGLHNVIGNVWEWCRDRGYRHDETVPRPGDGLQVPLVPDPAKVSRQLRGGSCFSDYAGARSTFFHQQPEINANIVFGLRPARALVLSASGPEPR
jgi:formylglycine-generating enzyme required for sulfatase activity